MIKSFHFNSVVLGNFATWAITMNPIFFILAQLRRKIYCESLVHLQIVNIRVFLK